MAVYCTVYSIQSRRPFLFFFFTYFLHYSLYYNNICSYLYVLISHSLSPAKKVDWLQFHLSQKEPPPQGPSHPKSLPTLFISLPFLGTLLFLFFLPYISLSPFFSLYLCFPSSPGDPYSSRF